MKKKILAVVIAAVLVLGCCIGGTIAWLIDKTENVVNTFTPSDINIELTESNNLDLKMVPGKELVKDPKVTVKANSEKCWVFVKVEKGNNPDYFLTYAIAEGWTELETGVYYREVSSSTSDQVFSVLEDDKVTVKSEVTKADLTAQNFEKPTLTFKAYAIQKEGFETAAAAWAEAKK